MLIDYLKFAWSSLANKKLRSWLTLIGILIGVTSVVSLIGLGDGLKAAVNSQFGISSTELITVQAGGLSGQGPPGSGVTDPLTQKDVSNIGHLSSVDLAIPRIIEQGKLTFNKKASFGVAMSIPDGEARNFIYDAFSFDTETGRLLKQGDLKKVNLGYNFGVDKVGLGKSIKVGDTVNMFDEDFTVVGIYEKQGSFIFDNIVAINEQPLRDLMTDRDRVDLIAVKVKNSDLMKKARDDIEKLLRKTRGVKLGEEDFSVQTPDAALSSVNSVLSGVQAFIVLIASVSIIVGAIGIVNTMTTSVLERKKQIGVMKAIGARNKDIFFQFFIESGLMGLIGGIIGSIFGAIIAYVGTIGISNFIGAELKPSINISLIVLTLVGSFLLGAFAGIIPAMNAAKQRPVDALRD